MRSLLVHAKDFALVLESFQPTLKQTEEAKEANVA